LPELLTGILLEHINRAGAVIAEMFSRRVIKPRRNLDCEHQLERASLYLHVAEKAKNVDVAIVLCRDTEAMLSRAKRTARRTKDQDICAKIAAVYEGLVDLLDKKDHVKAKAMRGKREKWEKWRYA
jgi:transaldolase